MRVSIIGQFKDKGFCRKRNDDDIIIKAPEGTDSEAMDDNDQQTFDVLERNFMEVLQEIGGHESSQRYQQQHHQSS